MYKITWDKKTGGVQLNLHAVSDTLTVAPRPVFWEELDLLKLNEKGWIYPHSKEPIMWACYKQYFYRGEFLFDVQGANLYDAPTVNLAYGVNPMRLDPVNIKKMLAKNRDPMFLIESEAIDFIRDTFLSYSDATKSADRVNANRMDYEALVRHIEKDTKQKMAIIKEDCDSFDIMPLETAKKQGKRIYQTTKIDYVIASFSGGKDSQVILDLCTRAIPPTDFQVMYSDTGYELPTSLSLYKEIEEDYKRQFPDLKFHITKNHESVINYWDKIGTPSDTHRWCCSVMKTSPLYRSLKVPGTNKQGQVLAFDGVRAEESSRRAEYDRIGIGVKHSTTINARPIFLWNTTEVFLYLFKYDLPINIAYRRGMTRVGCLICPFGSEWNEMISHTYYPNQLLPFTDRLRQYAKEANVKDIDEYLRQGGWKRRGGGNFVDKKSFVEFKSLSPKFVSIIKNPNLDVLSYFQTIGDYVVQGGNEVKKGELRIKDNAYEFSLIKEKQNSHDYRLSFDNIADAKLIGYIKKVIYKSTYCVHCEACEVECPTGALSVYPIVKINKDLCIHCHRCLDFHDKGCIVANSLSTSNNMNTKQGNIDRYKNFGLREEWLEAYFSELNNYWNSDHGLNENYQIPSLKSWLKDAGIINPNCDVTALGKTLADIRMDMPEVVWEIVWINLTYSSFIVGWFVRNIAPGSQFSSKLMEELILNEYLSYKEKTVHNAVYQIQRTLKESPIGNRLMQFIPIDKEHIQRGNYDDLNEISLAYSLYKYGEAHNIHSLRVSDFYQAGCDGGPFVEFGISKPAFEKVLRTLNSACNRVLIAELNMGLDHISLREDLTSESVLKQLL